MDNNINPTPNQPQPGTDPPQPQNETPPSEPLVESTPPMQQQVIQPATASANSPLQSDVNQASTPDTTIQSFSVPPQTDLNTQLSQSQPNMSSAPIQPEPENNPRIKKLLMTVGIVGIFLIAIGSAAYFAFAHNNAKDDIVVLRSQIAELDRNTHELPEGLIQVTGCIPNMGFHYIDPSNDPRFGPTYLVSKDGEVIGYEYMFNNSMLTNIPGQEIALEVLLTEGPVDLHDWQYNSIEFGRSPEGHGGFEEDHVDVHLYTVTPEEQARACEQ